MPSDLMFPIIVLLAVALVASAIELRASLRAPVCPRCVHCRHEALAKAQQDSHGWRASMSSRWRFDDPDDDERRRP
jgi:hypothetical protein